MSLVGCAGLLHALHLSPHALPALPMPLVLVPSGSAHGARVHLQLSPSISGFTAVSCHIWEHTPQLFLSCEGTFWFMRAICEEQLRDDS